MLDRRRLLFGCLSGLATCIGACVPRAFADPFDKPVHIVVGFQPGGSLDMVARVLAEEMKNYAATLIVDNKPGAGGRIALDAIKHGPTDGTVMVVTPSAALVLNPHIYKTLSYDPIRDFAPVTSVGVTGFDLAVGPKVPDSVRSLTEFVGWCKAHPAEATYGSPGAGTAHQFVGTMFARAAGINLVHVPYRGAAPAIQDLLAGQIASNISVGAHLPFYREGKLRILATAGRERSPFLPEVPTFLEAGYDIVATDWFGIVVASETPAPVVLHLNEAIRRAISSPAMQDLMVRLGDTPSGEPPEAFADRIRNDLTAWGPIVKAAGFTAQD
jgi:tripartite-type tricarboxylate transporter receptor subunit TctC